MTLAGRLMQRQPTGRRLTYALRLPTNELNNGDGGVVRPLDVEDVQASTVDAIYQHPLFGCRNGGFRRAVLRDIEDPVEEFKALAAGRMELGYPVVELRVPLNPANGVRLRRSVSQLQMPDAHLLCGAELPPSAA